MKRFLALLSLPGLVLLMATCLLGQDEVDHAAVLTWHPGGTYARNIRYKIYRSQLPTTGFVVLDTESVDKWLYIDLRVISQQRYYYRITAYDPLTGKESPPSITVSAVIP